MKSISLKQFASLLESNKSQFVGSLGWKKDLAKAVEIIDKQLENITINYNRTATVSSSKIVKFTYKIDSEVKTSRLDLSGVVYIYKSVYINIDKQNCICMYLIENN